MNLQYNTEFNLSNLSKINVLLGKNGCGKSTLLKKIETRLIQQKVGEINYVTPERGGTLSYNASVEQNSTNDDNWLKESKRKNQWNQFKEYSITQFRKLELLSLREIEKNKEIRKNLEYSFDSIVEKINNLLTNIRIERSSKNGFEIIHKSSGNKLQPAQISSGESELISLTIECLTFSKSCEDGKNNILLLDEPDVHLHPDLQANLIKFLITLVDSSNFKIILTTHSTAILGALMDYHHSRFAVLSNGGTAIEFKEINSKYQDILPIFGAHPLSNLFNQNPIILVEGEDDVRIFQQAIRTAKGKIKLYPCSVDGTPNMIDYETSVIELLNGVYDNANAYSLRDRDDGDDTIEDLPPLIRIKTSCRAAENLILTDEVLENLGTNWTLLKEEIEKWIATFSTHPKFSVMKNFLDSGLDRKNFDLKEIRNILTGLTPSSKPWEIAVGQVIGKIAICQLPKNYSENTICNYLGSKLINNIIK